MIDVASRRDDSSSAAQVTRVFAEHADFVWRSLRRLGVAAADADDVLQEVFLVVHRRISEYEDRGLMRAWLFSISQQLSKHYHRSAKRMEERQRGVVTNAPGTDLEEAVARREADQVVNAFLDGLDESLRLAFYLSDVEGLTAPEISSALGVKLNTVYSRVRKARKLFDDLLASRAREELEAP